MGQRGRPTARIVLSDDERETLERWARRRKTQQALALRCRIVLAAAEGATNQQIAKKLECNPVTVGKWRTRFAEKRLDGLMDEPRPGQPRKITDEIVEQVIVTTLESTPDDGSTQWSTRSMAAKVGLNQTAVSRIWRTFGLKPHRIDDFKLSTDPQFIDKVRDVVGLYLNPPDAAVVLCAVEKTQVQALDRTAPVLPMLPGTPARQSYTYIRNGTSDLYAALDVASGRVITQMTDQHRAVEFRAFLNLIDRSVPDGLAVHVICDNASTHQAPEIQRWLKRHRRFTLHYTPTYSSWLNQVERWFSELTTKKLRRATHRSVDELRHDINDWVAHWNANHARSCGARPPTRSSTTSPHISNESTTHDTSWSFPSSPGRRASWAGTGAIAAARGGSGARASTASACDTRRTSARRPPSPRSSEIGGRTTPR